jgi:Domain of unknown function (DUF4276)
MNSAVARKSSMKRLIVHVEGETEERFVKHVLTPHLIASGYLFIGARIFGNARQRNRRGGIRPWDSARDDILRHLKQDSGIVATTMVDYYGLPQGEGRAWPGRVEASTLPFDEKGPTVEAAVAREIAFAMGWHGAYGNRFIPFVVMHEFDALLFSDCSSFATAIGRPALASSLQGIRDGCGTPEEINDSPTTAPSKRIEGLVPGYQKPLLGTAAALAIGLAAMRKACPHFNRWVSALEVRALFS